jgi:hypothetical protein
MLSEATADANVGGVQTNPDICEDDSTARAAKWNEPPNDIHDWCSYSYSWNGQPASGSAYQGLELTDFQRVTSEYTGTEAESILDVASDPNNKFLQSICKQREKGMVQDGHFKSASKFLEGSGPSRNWGKHGRVVALHDDIVSVDIALHESPAIAQGLIVSTRIVFDKDGIFKIGERSDNTKANFDTFSEGPKYLLEQTKGFTVKQISKQLHTGKEMHVAEVGRKYEDGVEGVVGAAFTMWFAVAPTDEDLEKASFAIVLGRRTCREFCPDLDSDADSFKEIDSASKELKAPTVDSTCGTVLSSDDWIVSTGDQTLTNPNDKWLALCTAINTRPTTLTHGGKSYDGNSAECCKACAAAKPPCVFHSNDKYACMKDTACEWTDPDGGPDCASAFSDPVTCAALGGGCSIDSSTGMCTGGSGVATCQPSSGSGSGIKARRARSDNLELELELDDSEGAKRARRYDSSSSVAVGSASDPSATSTWIWTQAALMPPVCSGLLGIAGVTDASYDNPVATTPCTKGCGGMVDPRNSHAMNELNWLLGVVLAILAFLQIGSMAMSGDGGEPTKAANLIVAVIAAHVIVGLWLMWDDGMSCTEYLVEFSGEPQQVMSRLAWHWPHVITSQGILWPYIIGILLASIVGGLALFGFFSEGTLSGSAAFQAVAMIAPLLTLVTMEIFVAVGTYGAMTAGRSEDPDEKMNFWVAEAFAKMGGEAVDRNTSLAVGGWLVVVAFMVVSVGTTAISAYTYGLRGMVVDPAGMPATAVLQAFLFPGAVMLATEAYAAAKHADRVWHGPNDSYMGVSDVLDFCASTSWIDTTITEAGMVVLYVFALAMPVALGLALLTLIATRGDGSSTSAAARMVALVATAGTVCLTVYMFVWQKLGHCLTVPITPGFAYFAPFFTTVGVTVLAITATAIVAGIGDAPPAYTAKMTASYAGYFGASTASTSFM